jgi:hypothetical protein
MADKIPNIEFLGRTFNHVKLDPFQMEEAATTRNAFQLDCTQLTPNGQWLFPANSTYSIMTDGGYQSCKIDQSTYHSVSDAFSETANAGVSVPGVVSFKASTTVKESSKSIEENTTTAVWAMNYQHLHKIVLNVDSPVDPAPPLDPSFASRVADLDVIIRDDTSSWTWTVAPALNGGTEAEALEQAAKLVAVEVEAQQREAAAKARNDEMGRQMAATNPAALRKALAFLQDFGSYYAKGVILGGIMYRKTDISQTSMATFTSQEIDVTASAQGTFEDVTGDGSSTTTTRHDGVYKDNTESIATATSSTGGTANIFDVAKWAPTIPASPSMAGVTMRPIYELFTNQFFPNDPNIAQKQEMMQWLIEGSQPSTPPSSGTYNMDNVYAYMNRSDDDPNNFRWSYFGVQARLAQYQCWLDDSEFHT